MTVKIYVTNETAGFDLLIDLLDSYTEQVFDLAEQVYDDMSPDFLTEFRRQPRVRSYPADYPGGQLPFDTEKQRRWYWANIGKPYTRTGKMAANLTQTVERDNEMFAIEAAYPSESTKYVLDDIFGVTRYQQRFHAATGWERAAPKLERHADEYSRTLVRRYERFIGTYNE